MNCFLEFSELNIFYVFVDQSSLIGYVGALGAQTHFAQMNNFSRNKCCSSPFGPLVFSFFPLCVYKLLKPCLSDMFKDINSGYCAFHK